MGRETAGSGSVEAMLALAQLLTAQAQLMLNQAHILLLQAQLPRSPPHAHGRRRRRRGGRAGRTDSSASSASSAERYYIATPGWSDDGGDAFSVPTTCVAGSIPAKLVSFDADIDTGLGAGAEQLQFQALSDDCAPPFLIDVSNISNAVEENTVQALSVIHLFGRLCFRR